MALLRLSQLLLLSLSASSAMASFSLYPTMDADSFASSLGISSSCLAALNETVTCDSTNFHRLKKVDYYYWNSDNITTLCTDDCMASALAWNETVNTECIDDTIAYMGMAVPAATIAGRFLEGMNLACLLDSDDNQCMVESQTWVGSDMIYYEDGTLAEQQPLTEMYNSSLICSECFVLTVQTRLNSPYVPNSQHTDYLAVEFAAIVDYCGYDNTTYTVNQVYASYTTASTTTTAISSATSSASSTAATCSGQTIATTASVARRQLVDDSEAFANVSSTCEEMAVEYGVTSGDLVMAAGNTDCNTTVPLCVPNECYVQEVSDGETCTSIAAALSNSTNTVTTVQLLTWNPYIIGVCDDLMSGQYICTTPPGGAWTVAIANITTNTTGEDGGITYSTSATRTVTTWTSTPSPIQTGLVSGCNGFYDVQSGDTCYDIAQNNSISLDTFYSWNPAVGDDCSGLESQEYVCVGISNSTSVSTTAIATSTTTTWAATPTPTQTGIVSGCDEFYYVESGDDCYDIATDNGITTNEFYEWNPAIGDDCSALWPDYYVCVGIITTVTSTSATVTTTSASKTTTGSITTPTPTQAGIVSDCDEFHLVVSGDGCYAIATEYSITLDEFYDYNPAVGDDCSSLWSGYYVCVGVSS